MSFGVPGRLLAFASQVLLAAAFLAGCLGGPSSGQEAGDAENAPTGTWIHRVSSDGSRQLAPVEDWTQEHGVLPVGGQRRTGSIAWEPTIGATPDGTLLVRGYARDAQVLRTRDQGATWQDVTPRVDEAAFPPLTGDPYLHVDAQTGRAFSLDMSPPLACNTLSVSDDGGDSWSMHPVACGLGAVNDRPTIWTSAPRGLPTVGYQNLVHYCVNSHQSTGCSRSIDGGQTWGPIRHLIFDEVEGQSCIEPTAVPGHPVSGPDGVLYLPRATWVDGLPRVAISRDDGLTWTEVLINDELPTTVLPSTCQPSSQSVHYYDVAFALDEANNAYALWVADVDGLPYLSVSHDAGMTWEEPLPIAPPGIETAWFPTLAAGSEGRLAAAYMGSPSDKSFPERNEEDVWNAHITILPSVTTAGSLMATGQANLAGDPLYRGQCGGGANLAGADGGPWRCPGIGDFLDLIVDPDGRPWATFVDACHLACQGGASNEAAEGVLGTVLAGPSLRHHGPLPTLEPAVAEPLQTSFFLNGTMYPPSGLGSHPAAFGGSYPERSTYEVLPNATAVVVEAQWENPGANIFLYVRGPNGGTFVGYPETPGLQTSFRVNLTGDLLTPFRYAYDVFGTAAIKEPYEIRITVAYP